MSETIYLVEATASNGTVYRFSTGTGYMSLPTDTPPNAYYAPRVDQPGLFRQNMFAVGTTSGSSSGGYGEITLFNTDGGLDALIDLGFDGQLCVVKEGQPGAPLSLFATVITGTIEQCETSWSMVTLRLKDKTALLQTPVQTVLYLGNNVLPAGREGGVDLKDKPKPRLFGVCNNVTPILVNTSKLIYQVNSGPVFDITAVHDGGNVGQIVKGADYATGALLEAAAQPPATNPPTAPATYTTCLAEGLFRLDYAPFLTLTCDVIQGATAADRTAGQIIKTLAAEKCGASGIATQSIADLDKAAPYTVGLYTGSSDMTAAAALDLLCASVGAWWGFDNLGLFWARQLTAPNAAQVLATLSEAEIDSIDRTATADGDKGVPPWRVNVDFSKNWTVQTSGLAGSVSGNQLVFQPDDVTQLTVDRRNLLALEYLRTKAEDATVKATHALAPEITISTSIDAAADAATEAARVLNLRKVRRDRLKVTIKADAIKYAANGFWDDEAINEVDSYYQAISTVTIGNYAYIFGGKAETTYRLDLTAPTGPWVLLDSSFPTMTYFGFCQDGTSIFVAGGYFGGSQSNCWRFDVASPGWQSGLISSLPAARYACTLDNYGGYLYLVGGTVSGVATASVIRLNKASPLSGWDDAGVTDLPAPRRKHSSVVYGGYLYIIGGEVSGSESRSVIRLNLATPTGAWEDAQVPDMTDPQTNAAATLSGSVVYIMGGTTSEPECLDLANLSAGWTTLKALPVTIPLPGAASCGKAVYLIGSKYGTIQNMTYRYRSNANPDDRSQLTSLGRTLMVKYPRYGYTSGRPMKIIGVESDLKSRIITLELWG